MFGSVARWKMTANGLWLRAQALPELKRCQQKWEPVLRFGNATDNIPNLEAPQADMGYAKNFRLHKENTGEFCLST